MNPNGCGATANTTRKRNAGGSETRKAQGCWPSPTLENQGDNEEEDEGEDEGEDDEKAEEQQKDKYDEDDDGSAPKG